MKTLANSTAQQKSHCPLAHTAQPQALCEHLRVQGVCVCVRVYACACVFVHVCVRVCVVSSYCWLSPPWSVVEYCRRKNCCGRG